MLRRVMILALCLTAGCLGKTPGAIEAQGEDWAAVFETCETAQLYKEKAEPALQAKCKDCHGAGGPGAGKFSMTAGSDLSPGQIGGNFSAFVGKLAADDGGDPDANPVLGYGLGNLGGHTKALQVSDDEYLKLREFIEDYRAL